METRLDRLMRALVQNKGELCEALGIKRTMLQYLRTGERNPSPALERKIIELERSVGIELPTSGRTPAEGVQGLENLARRDERLRIALRKIRLALDELEKTLEE